MAVVTRAPRRRPPRGHAADGGMRTFEDHGAVGDGRADDTDAVAAALEAAPAGGTLVGRSGARYRLTRPLAFTAADLTVDLNGATLLADVAMEPGASLITLRDGVGVILRGGTLEAAHPALLVSLVKLEGGQWCTVENLRADCDGATVVSIWSGRDHTVRDVRSVGGSLAVQCSIDCRVRDNLVENTPANGLGGLGYAPPAQQKGTRYTANTVRSWHRIGLEEYNPAGASGCISAVVRDNAFLGTGGAAWYGTIPVGFAISVIGSGALVQANWVEDGVFAGIEATASATRIVGNTISWPRGAREHDSGMHVNSTDPTPGVNAGAAVAFNAIRGGVAGVLLAACPTISTVAVVGTLAWDCFVGLALQPGPDDQRLREGSVVVGNAVALRREPGLRWTAPGRAWRQAGIAVDGPAAVAGNSVVGRGGACQLLTLAEPALGRVSLVGNRFEGGAAAPPHGIRGAWPEALAVGELAAPVGALPVTGPFGERAGLVPVYDIRGGDG